MLDPKDFNDCFRAMEKEPAFSGWLKNLPHQIKEETGFLKHGDIDLWKQAVNNLPAPEKTAIELADSVCISSETHIGDLSGVEEELRKLCPWRKGPYNFFGIHLDSEWRSDWKWQRISGHIESLENRMVLDVGCGNGYHLWRMREAGARFILGIDPSLLFWQQFSCVKRYAQTHPVFFLPLRSEDLPEKLSAFDTVFSMGVLYHRRSPLDHLIELRNTLKPGGELVLETLIIEQSGQNLLFPKDRYAQMRNVFFLPSPELMEEWLARCGFVDIRVVDKNQTSTEEQRVTSWVKSQSLKDFLDPENPDLTIEGYPAPVRAVFIAKKDSRFQ